MSESLCPLCNTSKKMHKAKRLYGTPVCSKCYYAFANRRQLAYLLDAFLWLLVTLPLQFAMDAVLFEIQASEGAFTAVNLTAGWVVLPMIFFLKDGFTGHSPGKWICGVQAVEPTTGEPAGFGQSWKRNLPLMIPIFPLIIAFMLQKGYRWGDGWAHTKVVWKKYRHHPVFTGLAACEKCEYDLTGNTSGVCPECGTPVSELSRQMLASRSPQAAHRAVPELVS